jgi:hypothetical protein
MMDQQPMNRFYWGGHRESLDVRRDRLDWLFDESYSSGGATGATALVPPLTPNMIAVQ